MHTHTHTHTHTHAHTHTPNTQRKIHWNGLRGNSNYDSHHEIHCDMPQKIPCRFHSFQGSPVKLK